MKKEIQSVSSKRREFPGNSLKLGCLACLKASIEHGVWSKEDE